MLRCRSSVDGRVVVPLTCRNAAEAQDWISKWVGLLGDIEPTTRAKYQYFIGAHILPAFGGRQLGSLTFEEIEGWDHAIPTRISARGHPGREGRPALVGCP